MFYQRNKGNVVCRILEVRTPNLKLWYDISYFHEVSDTDFTEKIYRESLI